MVLTAGLLAFGSDRTEADTALSSWYGPGSNGVPTAGGEHFDAYGDTAAPKTLPLGTELLVSYRGNVAQVVNDCGPHMGGVPATLTSRKGLRSSWGAVADSLGMDSPPPQVGAAVDEPSGTYLVQPGDSMSGIAAQLGTSTGCLMARNGIPNPNLIYGGETLLLERFVN